MDPRRGFTCFIPHHGPHICFFSAGAGAAAAVSGAQLCDAMRCNAGLWMQLPRPCRGPAEGCLAKKSVGELSQHCDYSSWDGHGYRAIALGCRLAHKHPTYILSYVERINFIRAVLPSPPCPTHNNRLRSSALCISWLELTLSIPRDKFERDERLC